MEKIQIQFKESDYKVYYDYCLKYYQIHDTVRKQSIHAFLDLFEKSIIIVDSQDIAQARLLLTHKCDDLKKDNNRTRGEGDTTTLHQTRICEDLLTFCADLEKIYRLIQKQGIVADYLMILGTFSRVMDEDRSSHNISRYNLNGEVIESLARPLAEIIRIRLGTDRQWRSVLRELSVIATRFNQRSAGLKFDLDIIQLVAPAVVSHFNKDVETREILSVLPSYFDESELDEFEAFLNQTPDLVNDDQDAGINWDTINGPLMVVARAVATQRDQWSLGSSKISASASLAFSHDLTPKDAAVSSSSPSSGMPPAGVNKKFDITVSPGLTTQVESSFRSFPESNPALPKNKRIQPFIPVIIGIAVIVLFIIGTLIVSGSWNIMGAGNTTNSTSVAIKNTTVTSKATIAVPKVTTAKPVSTPVPDTTATKIVVTPALSHVYSSTDIGNHLIEIAFGPDSSAIKKPTKDLITLSFSGSYTPQDVDLLNNFINQFNNYSSTTKISENVNFNSPGDVPLAFLPGTAINQIEINSKTSVSKNPDNGIIFFIKNDEKTYVNADLKGDQRDRIILRAILYNLGFYGETVKYTDSLFYSGTNTASELSDIDLKALQLMYGKKIVNGMTRASVKTLIQ